MLLYSRLIIIWEQHVEQIPWLAKKSVLATHSSARICAVKEGYHAICVMVKQKMNTCYYISQSRLANSLGESPGMGNP